QQQSSDHKHDPGAHTHVSIAPSLRHFIFWKINPTMMTPMATAYPAMATCPKGYPPYGPSTISLYTFMPPMTIRTIGVTYFRQTSHQPPILRSDSSLM